MMETPAIPAPPAPPPPPPGALDKFGKKGVNPFAAPAYLSLLSFPLYLLLYHFCISSLLSSLMFSSYLQRHELGDAKMTSKPQNALLPEVCKRIQEKESSKKMKEKKQI